MLLCYEVAREEGECGIEKAGNRRVGHAMPGDGMVVMVLLPVVRAL
jgi:hypothetical protein